MTDIFQQKKDKKILTSTKRSIRDVPLNKKASMTPLIHVEVKEEISDYVSTDKLVESEKIKHLTPTYGDITEIFPVNSFDENEINIKSNSDTTENNYHKYTQDIGVDTTTDQALKKVKIKREPAFESLTSFSEPSEQTETNLFLNDLKPGTSDQDRSQYANSHALVDSVKYTDELYPVIPTSKKPRVKKIDNFSKKESASSETFSLETESNYINKENVQDNLNSSFEPLHTKHHNKITVKILFSFLLILCFSLALTHTIFSKANIVITLPSEPVLLEKTLLADKIPYKSLTKSEIKTISVPELKTVSVTKKATGNVILYNNFSSEPYDLVKTTRLETANGSIYRISENIKIPGKKIINGKDIPGTISVKVEADIAGDIYNAKGGIDLRLPGLIKGTTRYINIYAKTAANFTGGRTSNAPDLSSPEITEEIVKIRKEIQSSVINNFSAENPNSIILQNSIQTTTVLGAPKTIEGNTTLEITLTTKAIALDAIALQSEIAKINIEKKIMPKSDELSLLSYEIAETENKDILSGKFAIIVSGAFRGQSSVTNESIISLIKGKTISSSRDVLLEQFSSSTIAIDTWPFWKDSLPNRGEKITIIIQ